MFTMIETRIAASIDAIADVDARGVIINTKRIEELDALIQSIPQISRETGRDTVRVRVATGYKENCGVTCNKLRNELENFAKRQARLERRANGAQKLDVLGELRQKEVEALSKASEMQKRVELLKNKQQDRSIMATLKAARFEAAIRAKEQAQEREIETAYLVHREGLKQEALSLQQEAWKRADERIKTAKARGIELAKERKEAAARGLSGRIEKVEAKIIALASDLAYLEEQEALAIAAKKARRG